MTTKTDEQITADQEANLILQQLADQAPSADEADKTDEVISRKMELESLAGTVNEEVVPMTVRTTSSAGYAYVWHTETARRVKVNRDMLRSQLKKTRDDGKAAFTVFPPSHLGSPVYGMTVKLGNLLCMLHERADQREYYTSLGLPVCKKSTIPSVFQVQRHMQTKHGEEWRTLEGMRVLAEREEDRKAQQAQTDAFMTMAEQGRAPVAPASEAPVVFTTLPVTDVPVENDQQGGIEVVRIEDKGHGPGHGRKKPKKPRGGLPVSLPCTVAGCGTVIEGKNKVGAISRLKKHMREEHA